MVFQNLSLFVTIIMPIRNEADFIARSLGSVLNQNYPHNQMEVLVADGMSEDNTCHIIQQLAETADIPVKIIENSGKIVPTGFNAALKQARGGIIVRVDGHTIIEQDYVAKCIEALQRSDADNVGGRMNAVGLGAFGEAVALATSTPFGIGGARFHYSNKEEFVDTVYMGAWRREIFERIGGFDEDLVRNQDDEFNYRLLANGGKILLSPLIRSTYFNRSRFRGLARQYFQYGLYKVRVMQKHPRQMRPRQFAPALLVSAIIGGGLLAPIHRFPRRLWFLTISIYTTANTVASVLTARRAGWKHLPMLPVIFATLHISYGVGFIGGLVQFRNRWKQKWNLQS